MFATPRDWARLGQLFLNDGVWKGERILPQGWVKYSRTPTPLAPKGEYGSHFWLNAGAKGDPKNRTYPSLPTDLYSMEGFNNQFVFIFPSRGIVLVRMGVTHDGSWKQEEFAARVLDSIRKKGERIKERAPMPVKLRFGRYAETVLKTEVSSASVCYALHAKYPALFAWIASFPV